MLTDLSHKAIRHAACAAVLLACSGLLFAKAPAAKPVPFASAPEELRAYFAQAQQADSIADPLARCLAMPDVPGNRWPAGLVKAHCEYARGPYLTVAEVTALVERKAFAELEARFRADLDKHYVKREPSEVIHRAFEVFDGSAESNRLSKAWLDSAPESGFALAARGAHYVGSAWEARGAKWASETEEWKLARMQMFASMAVELLEKSLKREPKLIHSHELLMDMARMVGDAENGLAAFKAASRLDPFCRSVGIKRMSALRPRWGGSFEAMAAYSDQLKPFEQVRPLLANVRAEYPAEQAWALAQEEKYKETAELLKPFAAESTAAGVHGWLGWSMAYAQLDGWSELVYLLQAVRFNDNADNYGEIGRVLQNKGELEWALSMYERALRLDPDEPLARVRVARVQFWLKRWPQAEQAYRSVVDDAQYRKEALTSLAVALRAMGQYDKVLAETSLLTKEFPDHAWGWMHQAQALSRLGQEKGATDAIRQFVKTADRNDAEQARLLDESSKFLKQIGKE